jgi:hypothetical protein
VQMSWQTHAIGIKLSDTTASWEIRGCLATNRPALPEPSQPLALPCNRPSSCWRGREIKKRAHRRPMTQLPTLLAPLQQHAPRGTGPRRPQDRTRRFVAGLRGCHNLRGRFDMRTGHGHVDMTRSRGRLKTGHIDLKVQRPLEDVKKSENLDKTPLLAMIGSLAP